MSRQSQRMKAAQSAGGLGRLLPIMSASLVLLLSGLFSCNGNSTGPGPQPRPEGWVFMGLARKHIERVRLLRLCSGEWTVENQNPEQR